MLTAIEAMRPIKLAEIRAARDRIAKAIVRTPLVRLELGPGPIVAVVSGGNIDLGKFCEIVCSSPS